MVGLLGATSNVLGSAGKLAGALGGGGGGPEVSSVSQSFSSGSMDRGLKLDTEKLVIGGLIILAIVFLRSK